MDIQVALMVLAIVNSASVNNGVHVSFWDYGSFWVYAYECGC